MLSTVGGTRDKKLTKRYPHSLRAVVGAGTRGGWGAVRRAEAGTRELGVLRRAGHVAGKLGWELDNFHGWGALPCILKAFDQAG